MSTQDHTNLRPLINTTINYLRARRELDDVLDVAIAQLAAHADKYGIHYDEANLRYLLSNGIHPMRIAWDIDAMQTRQPDEGDIDDGIDMDDVRSDTYR